MIFALHAEIERSGILYLDFMRIKFHYLRVMACKREEEEVSGEILILRIVTCEREQEEVPGEREQEEVPGEREQEEVPGEARGH
jgi:hypothetical protein